MKSLFLWIVSIFIYSNMNAQACQCVAYVKNRYTIAGGVGANGLAKDYGPLLMDKSNNFTKQSVPQNKDIIVIQPNCEGAGSAGHIALVATVETDKKGKIIALTIVGANQNRKPEWSENKCSNVSTMRIANPSERCNAYYRNATKFIK